MKNEFHADSGLFIDIDELTLTDLSRIYPTRTQQILTTATESDSTSATDLETQLNKITDTATICASSRD